VAVSAARFFGTARPRVHRGLIISGISSWLARAERAALRDVPRLPDPLRRGDGRRRHRASVPGLYEYFGAVRGRA